MVELRWNDSVPGAAFPPAEQPDGAVCVENIGPRERRRRAVFGLLALAVGLALAAALVLSGANRWWRLVLFLPFAGSAAGFLQAREKT